MTLDDQDGPWALDEFKLFLSHTARHKAQAGAVSASLKQYGICGFVAHEDIEPGERWQKIIEEALRTADGLAAR